MLISVEQNTKKQRGKIQILVPSGSIIIHGSEYVIYISVFIYNFYNWYISIFT